MLATLLAVAAAEWPFRLLVEHQLARHAATLAPIVRTDSNRRLLYSFIPNSEANRGLIRINSQGYRDEEFPSPDARRGMFLVLCLGDSVTFGGRVRLEDTYPKRLAKALDGRAGGQSVRVMNTGVPGYNSVQELAVLETLGPRYSPDLVLLGWVLNDFDPPANVYGWGAIVQHIYPMPTLADFSWRRLAYQSRLIIHLKEQVKAVQRRATWLFPDSLFYLNLPLKRPEWQRMKATVLEIATLARQYGSEFMVVLFPYEVQLRRATTPPQADVAAFLRHHGIRVLDVFRALSAHRAASPFVADGIHLTELGHRVVADEILSELLRQRLVPPHPSERSP